MPPKRGRSTTTTKKDAEKVKSVTKGVKKLSVSPEKPAIKGKKRNIDEVTKGKNKETSPAKKLIK